MLFQVLHRRKHVCPFQVGVMSSINSIPHEADSTTKVEELECSLCITGRESKWFLITLIGLHLYSTVIGTVNEGRDYNNVT